MLTDEKRSEIYRLNRRKITQERISKITGVSKRTVQATLEERKRVVVVSDLHCGHMAGLTHPDWQWNAENKWRARYAKQQQEMWDWYAALIESLQPIDVLIVAGDCIDGKGSKSGATELITADRDTQVEMAIEALSICHAPKISMVYGSDYHTGMTEDFENAVARGLEKKANVSIGGHEFLNINGIIFDIKHFISGSSVPHGRLTPLAKSKLWNKLWAQEHEQQPDAHVLIRGHVHYFMYAGGSNWLGIICGALQGWGSKYGIRKCEGHVDTGLVWFDIPKKASCIQDIRWDYDIPIFETQKVQVRSV
jgi:predicted MPP superfamily phosphohydrolase